VQVRATNEVLRYEATVAGERNPDSRFAEVVLQDVPPVIRTIHPCVYGGARDIVW
jgi:hypothetical protein